MNYPVHEKFSRRFFMRTTLSGVSAMMLGCSTTNNPSSISAQPDRDPQPYALDTEKHLFIDDFLVARSSNVIFQVNPPKIRESVIRNDRDWENIEAYSCVIDDGSGIYKLYYCNSKGDASNVALATSKDGIHWEKPDLGLIEFKGSRANNIVIDKAIGGTVFYDMHEKNPERRYKYLTNYPIDDKPNTPTVEGIVMYTSPDGLHWRKHEVSLLPYIQDSQAVMFWDPNVNKYVAYLRGSDEPLFAGGGRKVVRAEADDPMQPWPFQHNPKPFVIADHELPYLSGELPTVLRTDKDDPPDTDLYTNQVFLYPWAHRTYLAFPTAYYHYKGDRAYMSPVRDSNSGVGECQLAVSRDGIKWNRYRRPAYVKHGWHGTDYDYMPFMFQGMLQRGRQIFQYMTVHHSTHGSGQFMTGFTRELDGVTLLEQQLDRFVAAEFDYTGGSLLTDPITFEGNRLILNVDTGGMGEARIGILTPDGNQIPGFAPNDCAIINGDWFDKNVSWRTGAELSSLRAKTIRLLFKMRGARLYSFQFTTSDS
jgi:hypothetical protein